MPGKRQAPTVRLRRLAAELRRLREGSNLSREAVAEQTSVNEATLYRIEKAHVRPQTRTLQALLDLYEVQDPERSDLIELCRQAGRHGSLPLLSAGLPEHYTTYIGFEAEARSVRNYQSLFVPGLLQTEDYARALIRGVLPTASSDEVEARVSARMERQSVLSKDDPLDLWCILDEAAIRRRVGDSQVMLDQLNRLTEQGSSPNVTLQIIPFDAGAHPGMPGSFVIIDFPDAADSDVIYVDSMAGDLLLEEESDIARYTLMYEHLRAVALSPSVSTTLITDAAEGHR